MPILDHHRAQFDAGTQTKLENYLVAWLPTFIPWDACKQVYICDFFVGPGRDKVTSEGGTVEKSGISISDNFTDTNPLFLHE